MRQHEADRYVKKLTTWNQFIALLYAQSTGKESLRDIETGLLIQSEKWAHLGVRSVARSSLSYANNHRDYRIYEQLFYEILSQCQGVAVRKSFSFTNPLYSRTRPLFNSVCQSLTGQPIPKPKEPSSFILCLITQP